MATIRKSHLKMTAAEWQVFIDAVNDMHGIGTQAPAYRQFVSIHNQAMTTATGMTWGVHTMPSMGMVGRNFLPWHRKFILKLEKRLQKFNHTAFLPYWDWIADPNPPPAISSAALLASWSVTRSFHSSQMPVAADVSAVNQRTTFASFQSALEAVHGQVHNAVGGDMMTASSPADPIFFLHHANIDRLWSLWQAKHSTAKPSNPNETLKPSPFIGGKVSSVLKTSTLGYSYA